MLGKRWIRHFFFWISYLLILTVYYMDSHYEHLYRILLYLATGMPVFLAFSYLSMYFLIPFGIKPGKLRYLIIYFLLATVLFSLLFQLSTHFLFYRYFNPDFFARSSILNYPEIAGNMIWIIISFLMFAAAKLIRDYLLEMKRKSEMEKINMETELSLLTAQLHPHFLFNTLNNLYSLALSGSPKTVVGLQKISGLMKYILYECGQTEISIKKEVNLIDNYLELEKLRYDKRLTVIFECDLENENLLIAPMILFTFVENCFKHGSSKATGNSFINIALSTRGKSLVFHAENSIPESIPDNRNERNGLGLENVKKRLEFLYPSKHTLEFKSEQKRFCVNLTIENLNTIP